MSQYNKEYFERTKELLAIVSGDGSFEEVSKYWEQTIGWTVEEMKSKKYLDLVHPDDIEKTIQAAERHHRVGGSSGYFENRFLHKEGGYVWLQWDGFIFEETKFYSVARNITVLKEKEFFFEEMQKIAKIGCWKVDLKTAEVLVSNEIYRIHEVEEGSYFDISKGLTYFPEETRELLQEKASNLAEKKEPYDLELPFITAKGNSRTVRIIGRSRESTGTSDVYGLLQDITEQVTKQKELDTQRIKNINTAKMASLGEMAANIAHEINNPLSLILGRAEQLKDKLVADRVTREEVIAGLDQIQKTSSRIAKIIKSLKTFSRSDEFTTFAKTPLKNIVEDSLELCFEKLKNDGYSVVVSEIPNIEINCRSAQLSQVFLNLINNSVEAMADKKEKWIKLNFKLNKGYVLIEVIDNGQGIEQSIRDKIMQPFFTTKENKGTGLGLSISNGIISAHKGRFYYDESKERTTFCIELPYT